MRCTINSINFFVYTIKASTKSYLLEKMYPVPQFLLDLYYKELQSIYMDCDNS